MTLNKITIFKNVLNENTLQLFKSIENIRPIPNNAFHRENCFRITEILNSNKLN